MSVLAKLDHFVEHDLSHTKLGLSAITLLRKTRISRNIRKRIVFRMMDKGTYDVSGQKERAKEFFRNNQTRIDTICSWLSDEESKLTYLRAIRFRCSMNRRDLPKYSHEEEQYFDPVVKLTDREVFVDCGAYIGDTADQFIKRTNGQYNRIVCFEPDGQNFRSLQEKNVPGLAAIHSGVWNENTELCFEADNATASRISEAGAGQSVKVRVCTIDSTPECADATFIKMDIEGAELPALEGARETILRNRPKLAICIYHSDEDMLRIAEYVHSLNPDYRLYVRHYSYETHETVLYAV